MPPVSWKVSLHGGHSGEFCGHAKGLLRECIKAAIAQDMAIFGLSEHCPRYEDTQIFPEEAAVDWTVETLIDKFDAYERAVAPLVEEFAGRIQLLKGFETEGIDDSYYPRMRALRDRGRFDYTVGSVHHAHGICIDSNTQWFEEAMHVAGGLEQLAIDYYAGVRKLVRALSPEIVGHLDLITKFGDQYGPLDTPGIRDAVGETLDVVKEHHGILDLNVSPLRRGKDTPYPAPWIVELARDRGIPFCFGDDSHGPDTVGVGLDDGRAYLLAHGVTTVTCLTKKDGAAERVVIPLE